MSGAELMVLQGENEFIIRTLRKKKCNFCSYISICVYPPPRKYQDGILKAVTAVLPFNN